MARATMRPGWMGASLSVAWLVAGSACGEGDAAEPAQAMLDFEMARAQLPTGLDLQDSVLTKTCSPNPGVCHNGREYPELHTFAALVDTVGAPCNAAPPAPELGWDACERAPYWFQVGDFATPIASTQSLGGAEWVVSVAHPIPAEALPTETVHGDASSLFQILDARGELALAPSDEWSVTAWTTEDQLAVGFRFEANGGFGLSPVVDPLMEAVVGGDPNGNGVWGASAIDAQRAAMVVPGNRERSYLWRRLIGDVPGDRMPIANGPVSNPQLLALGCWIEGLSEGERVDPSAWIDYEACSFAEDPPVLVEPDTLDLEDSDR